MQSGCYKSKGKLCTAREIVSLRNITGHTLDKIILLQEDLPEPTLTTWIILEVELVKSMKSALVSMNV